MHSFPNTAETFLSVAGLVDLALLHFYLAWLAPYRVAGVCVPAPELGAYRLLGWLLVAILLALLVYLCGGQYAGWPLG